MEWQARLGPLPRAAIKHAVPPLAGTLALKLFCHCEARVGDARWTSDGLALSITHCVGADGLHAKTTGSEPVREPDVFFVHHRTFTAEADGLEPDAVMCRRRHLLLVLPQELFNAARQVHGKARSVTLPSRATNPE